MKNNHSMFRRLFVSTAAIIIISMFITITVLGIITVNYFSHQQKKTLTECCNTVSQYCCGNTEEIAEKFSKICDVVATSTDSAVLVTDTNGMALCCSCKEYKANGACIHTSERPEFTKSHRKSKTDGGIFFALKRFAGIEDSMHFSATAPIHSTTKKNAQITGYVVSVSDTSRLMSLYRWLRRLYIASALGTMIFMFAAQYVSTYRITKPLRQMSAAAIAMSKGDFSKRIPVTGDDEIGNLATAFNRMTASLSRLEQTRRSFIANVSHELKTPMTTISGFIDGIIDGTIPPQKQGYYLNIISDETKRLSRVVESMLSLARLESGNEKLTLHRFDISALVCGVVLSREQSITAKNIDIRGLDVLSPAFVLADRDLIHQVVYNLVDNAVKFTNQDGYIYFNVLSRENGVTVLVRNSGQTVSKEALPQVFERFYKEDRSRSAKKNSTGLGLYIAKTVIELHGGNIKVTAKENEYTEFSFFLPNKSNMQ